tara:strand:+ start:1830 stop:2315 length:486 start_codon:yes stop_codon:yes gene_type:complete
MEHFIFDPIIAGIVCCIAMDVWQRILFLTFNILPTNWSITGRWFMMLISKKIIFNQNLDHENPVRYELQIGWAFHYWVAIIYGFAYYFLLAVFDILDTSILSGLIFGLISVIVPWFFYLPVTGKGFMGNKTPNPTLTILLSTSSHVVVGVFLAIGFSFLGY